MASEYSRKKKYGITPSDYLGMLEKQGHKCAICALPASAQTKGLHVDHDHKTGKVRGLLCHHCNTSVLRTVENFSHLIPVATTYLETYL